MKLKEVFEQTVPGNVYQDMKAQKPHWWAGRKPGRELDKEKKDPRYDWKTWKKWRKKLKKMRKKNEAR